MANMAGLVGWLAKQARVRWWLEREKQAIKEKTGANADENTTKGLRGYIIFTQLQGANILLSQN